MVHPQYKLNPGDMFSVDPERVLFATGAPKPSPRSPHWNGVHNRKAGNSEQEAAKPEAEGESPEESSEPAQPVEHPEPVKSSQPVQPPKRPTLHASGRPADEVRRKIQNLVAQAQNLLAKKGDVSTEHKTEVGRFKARAEKAILHARKINVGDTILLEKQILDSIENLPSSSSDETQKLRNKWNTIHNESENRYRKEEKEYRKLEQEYKNPKDQEKPYRTPWRLREWMAPFAYIPRYLEVNQKVCSAVYLRHPVARPGLAEVPTPFAHETSQLAFLWYLKRSKPKS